MMKRKTMKIVKKIAYKSAIDTINPTCMFFSYQPKMPKSLEVIKHKK